MKERLSRMKICFMPVLVLVFSLLGYGPAELWLSNRGSAEMWFSIADILLPIGLLGIASLAVLLGLLLILPEKTYRISLAIITAVGVLLILQGLFLPNNYGALTGAEIDWSQYNGRLIYNTAIWLVVITAAIIWTIKDWQSFRTAAVFSAIMVLVVQAATLVTIGISGQNMKVNDTEKGTVFLTNENEFSISSKGNTIVFILDQFDAQIMCDLMEQYPNELQESFADFTFYHNTSGGATRTKFAIPYILTARINDTGDTYSVYLKDSFETSPLFQELRTGKYSTGFYTDESIVDRSQNVAIDNLSSGIKLRPTSEWGLTRSLLKMTAFKYLPHALKRFFWMYSFELSQWKGGSDGITAYTVDDVEFYHTLCENGLSLKDTEQGFRFFHLSGAHAPYTMNENIERVTDANVPEDMQALGSLRIVAEYIRQMKKLGTYDDANIFIMADHGDSGYLGYGISGYSGQESEHNPLFMVKLQKENKEYTSSELRLTYKDVPNMLVDALHGNLNIEDNYLEEGTRYFYACSESNNTYSIVEYASEGDAYDYDSWHATGVEYGYEKEDYTYTLGSKLFFGQNYGAMVKNHSIKGFTFLDADYNWSNGKTVEFRFDIGPINRNILLCFDYIAAINGFQRCYLYAGDLMIGSFVADEGAEKNLIIPKECVIDGSLYLRFELPDAYSPLEHGTGTDGRMLGLAFNSITLDLTDETFEPEAQCKLHEIEKVDIVFGPDGNADNYTIRGISEDHWTSSKNVELAFPSFNAEGELLLTMAYNIYGNQQHILVYANGQQIADYISVQEETKEITIPAGCVKDGYLKLELGLPDATVQNDIDKREVGLWFKTLTIIPTA